MKKHGLQIRKNDYICSVVVIDYNFFDFCIQHKKLQAQALLLHQIWSLRAQRIQCMRRKRRRFPVLFLMRIK